jgi:hypothetical protein
MIITTLALYVEQNIGLSVWHIDDILSVRLQLGVSEFTSKSRYYRLLLLKSKSKDLEIFFL